MKFSIHTRFGLHALAVGYTLISACAQSVSPPPVNDMDAKAQPVSEKFYEAIRNNNLPALKSLAASVGVNTKDARGATPLMYAAAFGNAKQVEFLLASGADTGARNEFNANALIWANGDPVKSRMLVSHGADVKVRTQQGRTPLMMAAKMPGNAELIRLLLAKGADPSDGADATLVPAIQSGDIQMVSMLVEAGAGVNAVSARSGNTPLHYAASAGNVEVVRFLLSKGAKVNAGVRNLTAVRGGSTLDMGIGKQTPLMWAAPSGSADLIGVLLKAGADVNASDIRGMTPLMLALASETQDVAVVKLLLQAGADVKAHDLRGETALDWAQKYGSRAVISVLREAGAKGTEPHDPPAPPKSDTTRDAAKAVERSIALLERSSHEFFKQSGCIGCHHQDVTAFAVRAARAAAIPVTESAARERLEAARANLLSQQEILIQGAVPDISLQANHLQGLWAAGYPSDMITDSAVVGLVSGQYPDGHWQKYTGTVRSPTADGAIVWTAEVVLALQRYSIPARQEEFRERIARACEWMLKTRPSSTYQHVLQLLALSEAGVPKKTLQPIADSLVAKQRSDGGWGGNPNLESEAHSTGLALHALRESNFLSPAGAPYRRAVQYLLSTQYPDGSWHVPSRAAGIQAYFQSGFPFDHDQWISAAGTGWAAEALARSIDVRAARPVGH